ncbi:MAG: GTP cyclohydrolase II [Saprospiraceae bacterium]|nr:GTP cyclohydrolase II [Saprospiraceae bacterium]
MSSKIRAKLPTEFGDFHIFTYPSNDELHPHVVLTHQGIDPKGIVPLRIHSECLTGDVFGSKRCDCGYQLKASMEYLSKYPGILIYLRQEGRGIGLIHKLEAYMLQDGGLDTVEANHQLGFEADLRTYEVAASILKEQKIKTVNLLSNNPVKREYLEDNGISVHKMIPIIKPLDEFNKKYLKTKREKLGHILPFI